MNGDMFRQVPRGLIGGMLICMLFAGPVLLFPACTDDEPTGPKPTEYGNGVIVRDTISGRTFSRVFFQNDKMSDHRGMALLHQADSFYSIVRVDENILRKHVYHSVSNSDLRISLWPEDTYPSPTVFEVEIGCPTLRQLSIRTNYCDFSSGFVLDSSLYITSRYGGKIVGKLEVPELKINMSNSTILLTGETVHLDITAVSASIYLQDFAARNVTVSSRDGGVVEVYCDDTLRVEGRVRSKIYYKGTPRKLFVDLDSTSTLEQL